MCLAGLGLAATPSAWTTPATPGWAPFQPSAVDSGGPDIWGYKWKQTADLGGPPYAPKDITSIGTLVTGLGDDNYVGPFPIGFTFHYYWYDVTQYWIGSNGYLEFGPPFNATQTFPSTMPLASEPNNYLGVYMADWDMSVGGTCRRWNNADSLVVLWSGIPAWSTGGSHTFEVILSRLDSNITYEYGVQTGIVSNNNILAGIENVSGTMGLPYIANQYPISNNAVKWTHPSNPTTVVHDMASIAAANTNSLGFFVNAGSSVTPTGIVQNAGNATENNFTVNCTIQLVGGGIVYNQTQTITTPLAPSATLPLTFSPNWTASATGTYMFKITVTLTGDLNPNNNLRTTEMGVMSLPGTMSYDNPGTIQAWSWIGGTGGLGNHFVPPSYPVVIDCVRFWIVGGGSQFDARVYSDNGAGGSPGTQLWTQTISTPTANTWYGGMPNLTINSGGFYVAWIKTDTSTTPTFGVDISTTQPVSRQGWEYTGVWSGFRLSETGDIMARAKIHNPTAAALDVNLTPNNPPIVIPAGGGSFSFDVSLTRLTGPAAPYSVWIRAKNPNGTYTGNLLGPVSVNTPVGTLVTRNRNQNIPGTWVPGLYLYLAYVNNTFAYPAIDSASFTFTKLAVGGAGPYVWDATCSGELFPGEVAVASTPTTFAVTGTYPNPFNPSTAISFTLPEASRVTLNVYDVNGRQVASLVNGLMDAGSHKVTFNGSSLSSGVYLYVLKGANQTATGKMVLMK